MTDSMRIDVEGLKDFRRQLRTAGDGRYSKELQRINKAAVQDIASAARRRYSSHYTSKRGKHVGSIRALASQRRAQVAIGGPKAPGALGQEFGSNSLPQFKAWRGSDSKAGYFLWPAIRSGIGQARQEYEAELDKLLRKAFPNKGIGAGGLR